MASIALLGQESCSSGGCVSGDTALVGGPTNSTAPQFKALEAAGTALNASLAAVREGFQQHQQELDEVANEWRHRLQAVAQSERKAGLELLDRCEFLGQEAVARRAGFQELEARAKLCEQLRDHIGAEVSEAAVRAMDQVLLDVRATRFEASARALCRSPWFARRLADLEAHSVPTHGTPPPRVGVEQSSGLKLSARVYGPIHVERDASLFHTVLSFLRTGPGAISNLAPFEEKERTALLGEAAFFELPALAGLLAAPPVGTSLPAVQLPSAVLASQGVESILFHIHCGSWHEPGRCYSSVCRHGGMVQVPGVVRAYEHAEPEPLWEVECAGHVFELRADQLGCHDPCVDVLVQA